jgi:hypothetical protein
MTGKSADHVWILARVVLERGVVTKSAAHQSGLQGKMLDSLRKWTLTTINRYHTQALWAISLSVTKPDVAALVNEGAVSVAVRLLDHSKSICVDNAVSFLTNIVTHSRGTDMDGLPHPHFADFVVASADKALRSIFDSRRSNTFQRSRSTVALCSLYKNRALPAGFDSVCEQLIKHLESQDAWERKEGLRSLTAIAHVTANVHFLRQSIVAVFLRLVLLAAHDFCSLSFSLFCFLDAAAQPQDSPTDTPHEIEPWTKDSLVTVLLACFAEKAEDSHALFNIGCCLCCLFRSSPLPDAVQQTIPAILTWCSENQSNLQGRANALHCLRYVSEANCLLLC